jgi:cellulose synthase (UDP-forming)
LSVSVNRAASGRPGQSADRHAQRSEPKLPVPPSDAEKDLYADRNLALIIRTSLASFGALLISQGRFVALSPPLLALSPLIAFTLAYYVISLFVNFGTHGFDIDAHHRLVRDWRPARYPDLDIFLPVCGEPIEVLRNTWEHVQRLLRAYPGLSTAYVLDDGASPEAQQLAEALGFSYLVRPDRGWMKKAGNLRYGFSQSSGEFILRLRAWCRGLA